MNEIIFTIAIVGGIILLKQFGQDIIEKMEWHKRKKKEGEKYWEWATTPPYFTLKKILYWILMGILLSVFIYLGFKMETIM